MTDGSFALWRVSRSELSKYLFAYGEIGLGVRALALSPALHERICDACVKYALYGIPLHKAAPLAAVYVLEGKRRDFKRQRPLGIDSTEPEPDAEELNRRAHLAEYSLGRPLKNREVLDGVAEVLTPQLPGFRYYRSQAQYRRPFADGTAFIGTITVRGTFNSFYFGITHRKVEEARARLFDPAWKASATTPSTILDETKYYGVDWPISGSHGLELAADDIRTFVDNIILPYLRTHEEPEAVRRTILEDPKHGHTAGFWPPHVTVFAVDALLGRRDWVDDDFGHYDRYYGEGPYRDSLRGHYEMAGKNWKTVAAPQI